MFAKLLTVTGLAAGLLVGVAPSAHADGCATDFVDRIVSGYYYVYRGPEGWVTVDGLDVQVNGSVIVDDTNWNVFVTQDYSGFVAANAIVFVNCVV